MESKSNRDHYLAAERQGLRYMEEKKAQHMDPYLVTLDDILEDKPDGGQVNLGLVNIPTELIAGTLTAGRRLAFAGNFMPVLDHTSEFYQKWVALCDAHLSPGGITDPIKCYEYMGRFYVQEGNKRVSVLKYFGAPVIQGFVTRIIPEWSEEAEVQAYYEFMRFYRLSGIYDISFRRSGQYSLLQKRLGLMPDEKWSIDFARRVRANFRAVCDSWPAVADGLDVTPSEAFLTLLEVYPYEEVDASPSDTIRKMLVAIRPDIALTVQPEPITLQEEPQEERSVISRLFRQNHAAIAFVHDRDPETSAWVTAHEQARKRLEKDFGRVLTALSYTCHEQDAYTVLAQAVNDGATAIFTTTPTLMDACRRAAADFPQVTFFNCSLFMPYAGVRSYYAKVHEGKFVSGAIAGIMADNNEIGYIADYPIMGVPAAINAFALGARLTNPRAKVHVRWTCLEGDPVKELRDMGISVISGREVLEAVPNSAGLWGLYRVGEDSVITALASPRWRWHAFYGMVVKAMLAGGLEKEAGHGKAVNYWCGLSTGVIGIDLSPDLPEGVRVLAQMLTRQIADGTFQPFARQMVSQDGAELNDGSRTLSAEELLTMNVLCDAVEGHIPAYEELREISKPTVQILGFDRAGGETP